MTIEWTELLHDSLKTEEGYIVSQEVIARCESQLPPHHRVTLSAKFVMAYLLLRLENYGEAEELARYLKQKFLETEGSYSGNALDMSRIEASSLRKQEKYYVGEKVQREVVENTKRVTGENSEQTLNERLQYADVLALSGQYEKAAEEMKDVSAKSCQYLSPFHELSYQTRFMYGLFLCYAEKAEEGACKMNEVVKEQEQKYGPHDYRVSQNK